MKFSLYSDMQYWGDRSPDEFYAEVMEQVVNADRLGYDAYALIEHWFFPEFSQSADPLAFFSACAQQTRRIAFRTLGHVLPYHNPAVLASRIAQAEILLGRDRYEFGIFRGHAWVPPKAGVAPGETRDLYEEAFDVLVKALSEERFSHEGKHWKVDNARIIPPVARDKRFRIFLGGTSDRTYELAAEHGWAVVVPPLLPYEALREQLDLYRERCAEHGTEPDIVWIHACYIDDDREVAKRDAELHMRRFLEGNAAPLPELAPAEELQAAGYGFYTSGVMEKRAATPYDEMIEGDIVWVGTPQDIIKRIEAVRDVCENLTEVSILVNAGGAPHWQAIKTQELFAGKVIPHFRGAPRAGREPVSA